MALLLLKVAAVLYLLVTAVGVVQLIRPREAKDRMVLFGLAVAMLFHALAIGGRTVEIEAFPAASMHDAISLFGFIAAVIGAVIAWKGGVPQSGPLTAVLVSVVTWIAVAIQPLDRLPDALRSPWLPVHIAFAFLGDAEIAIAGIVSLVYLVQERSLKHKKKSALRIGSGIHRLPSLEILDRVSVQLIQWGFPMMTLGIVTGMFYSHEVFGTYWTWDPRNTLALLTWALYAILLQVRLTIGWRGRKLAILTLVGVTVTLVAFVGLGALGIGAHGKEFLS
jgi:cytochrome c-type biogenesis protein CcsB